MNADNYNNLCLEGAMKIIFMPFSAIYIIIFDPNQFT